MSIPKQNKTKQKHEFLISMYDTAFIMAWL